MRNSQSSSATIALRVVSPFGDLETPSLIALISLCGWATLTPTRQKRERERARASIDNFATIIAVYVNTLDSGREGEGER